MQFRIQEGGTALLHYNVEDKMQFFACIRLL